MLVVPLVSFVTYADLHGYSQTCTDMHEHVLSPIMFITLLFTYYLFHSCFMAYIVCLPDLYEPASESWLEGSL